MDDDLNRRRNRFSDFDSFLKACREFEMNAKTHWFIVDDERMEQMREALDLTFRIQSETEDEIEIEYGIDDGSRDTGFIEIRGVCWELAWYRDLDSFLRISSLADFIEIGTSNDDKFVMTFTFKDVMKKVK